MKLSHIFHLANTYMHAIKKSNNFTLRSKKKPFKCRFNKTLFPSVNAHNALTTMHHDMEIQVTYPMIENHSFYFTFD